MTKKYYPGPYLIQELFAHERAVEIVIQALRTSEKYLSTPEGRKEAAARMKKLKSFWKK